MSKIVLENFAGGMTPDIRDDGNGVVKLIKHFDVLTRPNTITPYHSQVTGDAAASVNRIQDMLYFPSQLFYGVGVNSSSGKLTVYKNSSYTSSTWSALTNGASTTITSHLNGVFVEYHGFGYGINQSNSTIWKVDLTGATAFVDVAASLGFLAFNPPNGLVHSQDDVLYFGAGNVITSNNNGSWTQSALTLPSKYRITSLCEWGKYLAIGCSTNKFGTIGQPGIGSSVIYLWDRDATLNTVSEVIDLGSGEVMNLEQVEGEIIAVILRQDAYSALASKMVFKRYSGGVATTFKELLASSLTGFTIGHSQRQNQRMYFHAGIEIDGVLHQGIWCVGKNPQGKWIVWFDRLPNNDTVLSANSLLGFMAVGDMIYITYNDGGYVMTKTDSVANSYTGTSIIETVINPGIDGKLNAERTANKSLKVVALAYAPIPTGGQITFKWKVDNGSWNTARTETTIGRIVSEITQTEASFSSGREYQFRIESTGGVMPTALKYEYEVLKSII